MNSKLRKISTASLIIGISALVFYFIGMIFGIANLIFPYGIIFISIGLALSIPFIILFFIKVKSNPTNKTKKIKSKKYKAKSQGPEDEVVDYVNGKKEFEDLSVDAQVEYFEEWDE